MDKHFEKYFKKHLVDSAVGVQSAIKVVIPVYLEEDYLFATLKSLSHATERSGLKIEIVLVVNYAEDASYSLKIRQQRLSEQVTSKKIELESTHFYLTIINAFDIAVKHAGVGFARKVGMDYAANAFANNNQANGIIASLDADSLVEENYFVELSDTFADKNLSGCTIYFEHPLEGGYQSEIYDAISEYELHLRYYVQALRYAGFPYAYHTVGSCFAITANAYVKAGGMPKKQAGEDFYFLQKVIPQGSFAELSTTTVHPSPRPSARVPFGTGPSINKIVETGEEYLSYNLQSFIDLKAFLSIKESLYKINEDEIENCLHELSGRMRSYLLNSDFFEALQAVNNNCSSLAAFNKRFYEVFNAFRVVKYLNYTHEHFLEKTSVFDAATALISILENNEPDVIDTRDLLQLYRLIEKEQLTF